MPMFQVRRRVDAFIDYVANIEAETAHEAAELASEEESRLVWEEEGPCEFDARMFVTLDAEGGEIDGTQVGDR